jgi:hypothetical protein
VAEQFGKSQAVAPELHRTLDVSGANRGVMDP